MKKKIPFWAALGGLVSTAALMFYCMVILKTDLQLPLLLGCVIVSSVALAFRYRPGEICGSMVRGIRQSLGAVLLLLLIGVLMGVWIAAGIVPAMIYYGLRLIAPRLILPCAMLICAAVSMALDSWGTAGTVGLAFMGIARAAGIPLPLAAGAVISGCYVGDILSPIVDCPSLVAAVSGANVFDIIRSLFRLAVPVLAVSAVLYTALGWPYVGSLTAASLSEVDRLCAALSEAFRPEILSFLPPLIVIVCISLKLPAIPTILVGILTGGLYGALAQGVPLTELASCALYGYAGGSGLPAVDEMLTAGGLLSMLGTVTIIALAMAFGGVVQYTGQMDVLVRPLVSHLRGSFGLTAAVILTAVASNLILPDQYMGVTIPGQMYAGTYDRLGADRLDLAIAVSAGGALTSALVPWNTCGIFMSGVLGVEALRYLPYAFLAFGMILAVLLRSAVLQAKKAKPSQKA